MATFYDISRGALRVPMRGLWRMQTVGRSNVPRSGPLIVACNHISYVDPVALGCASPRRLLYMAKLELFEIPVFGRILLELGAYPVDRSRGDVAAIKRSVAILKAGNAVGIFPEGGRNRDGTAKPRSGAALLASLSGAPIVPAAIAGTRYSKQLHRVTVAFGEPFHVVRDRQARGDDLEKWTDEIMRRIRMLKESIGAD